MLFYNKIYYTPFNDGFPYTIDYRYYHTCNLAADSWGVSLLKSLHIYFHVLYNMSVCVCIALQDVHRNLKAPLCCMYMYHPESEESREILGFMFVMLISICMVHTFKALLYILYICTLH